MALYPDTLEPNFEQKLLSTRPELFELQSAAQPITGGLPGLIALRKRSCTNAFRLLPHQVFLRRFFSPDTPYQSALFFHGTGVGKSCTAINIAEAYLAEPANENRKVMIISNPAVQQSFRKEIFRYDPSNPSGLAAQCTGTSYLRKAERRQRNPFDLSLQADRTALDDVIQRLINRSYEFAGYIRWSNQIILQKENLSAPAFADWVHANFDFRLIIIDEAHNIRPSQSGSQKRVEQALRYIVQIAKGLKLILMSATPMFNEFTEIFWLLNLCLWNDKQQSANTELRVEDFFVGQHPRPKSPEALLRFRTIIGSYVSFVKGENPYTFPFKLDSRHAELPRSTHDMKNQRLLADERIVKTKLILTPIGVQQAMPYKNFISKEIDSIMSELMNDSSSPGGEDDSDDETESADHIISKLLQLGNVSTPDSTPFWKNFTFTADGGIAYKPGVAQFLGPDLIQQYAPKIASIIDSIKDSEGVVFIYSAFLTYGCVAAAIALEHAGYKPYKRPDGFLGGEEASRGSYMFFTGSHPLQAKNTNRSADLDVVRSAANREGKLVKIIIGSNQVGEGIDFKYIRQIHILEPWFNQSRIDQVVGRAIRTCSHSLLPFEKQNCTVYLHCLVDPNSKRELLDEEMYRISEIKARKIERITQFIQESAFDCNSRAHQNNPDESVLSLVIDQTLSESPQPTASIPLRKLGAEAGSCFFPGAGDSASDWIPTAFLRDRSSEIIERVRDLFLQESMYAERDFSLDPVLAAYSPASINSALYDAMKSNTLFVDKLKRRGYLRYVSQGSTPAWTLENPDFPDPDATAFERTHPMTTTADSVAMPTPSKRDLNNNGTPEHFRGLFQTFQQSQDSLLASVGVANEIIAAVSTEYAFDHYQIAKRHRLFKSMLEAEHQTVRSQEGERPTQSPTRNPLLERHWIPELNAYAILNGKAELEYYEPGGSSPLPVVGSFRVAVEAYWEDYLKAYIQIPSNVSIAMTDYNATKNTWEFKLITQKWVFHGRSCATIDKNTLQTYRATVGFSANPGATNQQTCVGIDAYHRFLSKTKPESFRYLHPEPRSFIDSLPKIKILAVAAALGFNPGEITI